MLRAKSESMYEKLSKVLPGGVNSPVRAFSNLGLTPIVVERGQADELIDVDGHRYIDFCASWGALILGHAYPSIVDVVKKQIEKGSSYGTTTPYEELFAQKICGHMPSIEKLRLVSSGTEALMTASRLVRHVTKRPYILKFNGNYHGHFDGFLLKSGSGSTDLTSLGSENIHFDYEKKCISIPYNDRELFNRVMNHPAFSDKIAAVVVEPIAANMGVVVPEGDFLKTLRYETSDKGALLIFDEVITGFRIGIGGAQDLFDIDPDITCLGKVIGGGFPLAAIGGKREFMDQIAPLGPVYQAGTLSGNPIAVSVGTQTLLELEEPNFYKELEEKTNLITKPVQEAFIEKNIPACVQQCGSVFTIFWGARKIERQEDLLQLNFDLFRRFFTYMFENGVYFPPSPYEACFVTKSHTKEHLQNTRDLILSFI